MQRKKDRIYRNETRLEAIVRGGEAAISVNKWEKEVEFLTADFLPGAALLPKKFWSQLYDELLAKVAEDVNRASVDYSKYRSLVNLDNTKLDLRSYVETRNSFSTVNGRLQKAGVSLSAIKKQFAEDVYEFSFEGQVVRAEQLSKSVDSISRKLGDYANFFSTSVAIQTVQRLKKQLVAIQLTLAQKVDAAQSFDALENLERELEQLSGEVSKMSSVADSLSDPSNTLGGVLTKGRSQLDGFSVDTDEEMRQLGLLEQGIDEVLRKFDPTRSYDRQLSIIESFQRRVQAIVSDAEIRDKDYQKEQQKKRDKVRRQHEEDDRRNRRSYDNSSGVFVSGLAGSYLGSSLGHSGSSSSSSGSSDFGGGSSGGWGGGGDSGGGSSGSW
jgi:regulator of replication initiation timing